MAAFTFYQQRKFDIVLALFIYKLKKKENDIVFEASKDNI